MHRPIERRKLNEVVAEQIHKKLVQASSRRA
jgi:hypothetical protein